jgi:hypothetical protein
VTKEQLAILSRYADVVGRAWFTAWCATLQLPYVLARPAPLLKRQVDRPLPVSDYVPEL